MKASTVSTASTDSSSTSYVSNESTPDPKSKSICWRGIKFTMFFAYDTPSSIAILVITGIALRNFIPFLSVPCFGISISILATRVVLKVLSRYNITALQKIKSQASEFTNKYPNIELITFLFSAAISSISFIAGYITAGAAGVLSGILLDVRIAEKRQQMTASSQKSADKISAMEKLIA